MKQGITIYIHELIKRKDLMKYLVVSALKAQHKNSFLGFFWWLLDPLLQIFIYFFVVVIIFQRAKGPEYGIYLAIGLIVWRWLSSSITTAVRSISSQSSIITQVYLPKATFPICTVMSQMVNFGFGMVVIALCLIFFHVKPGMENLWLPFIIGVQFLFMMAISLAVAFASIFIRDIEMIMGHVLRLWFYGTPVIWYADMIPERAKWILSINPMACFLSGYRDVVIHNSPPDYVYLAGVACMSGIVIFLLLNIYHRYEHKIIRAL
jgi:ABC-type polysaccharide/polyol phosphate export permease